ncbi:hypothetical protein METHB2_150040 [Candidatus Methylobacter favarea]|uniref:Uncharacterized protein n=1 Tax=Candidatus Methylobacter favarea TaxID=2707345 RepID=A0A8S0W9E6_9GAMM|nr:hypothetical protein [Candidatus Methylobacter favarea]CAA9889916.1 hypothetical protein METHB2_150040 [Candidatus Methylobacter favarea]
MTDIITLVAALIGGGYTLYIYTQNSKYQRAQVLFLLFEKFFYKAKYAEIRQLLDYGNEDKIRQFQVVLANHSDELLEEKFVDYLNFFEFSASLVQLKQLEINEVQSMFE